MNKEKKLNLFQTYNWPYFYDFGAFLIIYIYIKHVVRVSCSSIIDGSHGIYF